MTPPRGSAPSNRPGGVPRAMPVGQPADEPRDCQVDDGEVWFRLRSCLVVVRDGAVLVARNTRDPYHYSVGGGVHHGEAIEDAARREALEETGVVLEPRRLLFVHENFFRLGGRLAHEVAFYHLADDHPGIVTGYRMPTGAPGVEEWLEWLPLDAWHQQEVYPTVLPEVLAALAAAGDRYLPRLLVTRE